MAADGSSYAGRSTDDLLGQATETFNRQGTITRQMNGGLAWTAVEAATVMRLVINEVIFNEASTLGQTVPYVQEKYPDLLTRALQVIGGNKWRDDNGVRTIDEAVDFEVLGERATWLVKTLEERCTGTGGERKEAYGGLLGKARGFLLEHKGQSLITTAAATHLGKLIGSQEALRTNIASKTEEFRESLDQEKEGSHPSKRTIFLKKAIDKLNLRLTNAYAQGTRAARDLDTRIALKVTGDVAFGGQTFNGLASQLKILDAASLEAQQRHAEHKEPDRERKPTRGNAAAHKDAVKGNAARMFRNLWGTADVEWVEETPELHKVYTLYLASKLWKESKHLPDAAVLVLNEISSRCIQTSESNKPLPGMLEDLVKSIDFANMRLSFSEALKTVAEADVTCEIKFKRMMGLLALQKKTETRAPVAEWCDTPPHAFGWDALQHLITTLPDDDPHKVKLLELAASHGPDASMESMLSVCRTAERSCTMTGSGKRKATEPAAGDHTKRLYTLDASKNGSCSFCNASDHTMATCKLSQAQQAELLVLNSQGLVHVPGQGMWNAGRYVEKLASQNTSASPQQPPMQQAPPQQPMQQPNFQQPPPGWQPQQLVQQWQQQHGGQQHQAPYQQNTGGPVSGQQQGNGNGAPSRGQGNYQGQQQGNYGSDRGHQRRQSTRCIRCGSPGHVTSGCQNPEKCFNCNGYGHRAMTCNLPPSPKPDRRSATHYTGAQGALSGSNLVQPMIQQLQQPAFQQMQQPNMLTASQPIIQQLPQIVHQPSVQSHPGLQCACCQQMGHISGMCPSRQR